MYKQSIEGREKWYFEKTNRRINPSCADHKGIRENTRIKENLWRKAMVFQ